MRATRHSLLLFEVCCYYLRCLVFCTGLCKCKFQVHVVCTTLRYVANVAETIPYSGTALCAIYFARREKSHNPELQTLFDHLYFFAMGHLLRRGSVI